VARDVQQRVLVAQAQADAHGSDPGHKDAGASGGPRPQWNPPHCEELERAVRVPAIDPHFYISPEVELVLVAALERAEREGAVNVLVAGDPGWGKSTLPRQMAALAGRLFFAVDCGTLRQASEFYGVRELEGDRTAFYASAFVHALSIGGAIVVLDEINRISPYVLNGLLPVLDHRRRTYLDALRQYVEVAPGTVIVGTVNLGGGFSGTYRLDEALVDRFATTLRLQPPTWAKVAEILVAKTSCSRTHAGQIVRIAEAINRRAQGGPTQSPLSRKVGMRSLLEAGHWVRSGLSLGHACRLAIVDGYSAEGDEASERYQVEQIILGILGPRAYEA
jgi:MoxR-like ATPase